MVALGAAADDDDLIMARFRSRTLNKAGVVMVQMFVNGREEWIMMDDYLPCQHGRPCFVRSKQEGEVWPCFLEKAWAKMTGSYARMEAG